jgi:concanavalin A-like lectin/glucanase superfamily protein
VAVSTTNLVAWYRFDESTTGSNASDATGGGKTLTNNNSAAFASGKISNATNLVKASNQYFQRFGDTAFSLPGDLTISVWVKPASAGDPTYGGSIVQYITDNAMVVGDFQLGDMGSRVFWQDYVSGGALRAERTAASTLPVGSWTHIVARRASGATTIWLNGSNSPLTTVATSEGWGAGKFCVGSGYPFSDSTWNFDGLIDMLGIWSRALSDSEIGELYASGAGLDYPFAGGGALTKNLSDAIALSENRSASASFNRSIANPLGVGEALSKRIPKGLADGITLGENVAKLRLKALADPLTIGELVTPKLLQKALSDSITLGEFVGKQILLPAYSDDFNRANSTNVGSSWNENLSGVQIQSNALNFTNTGNFSSVVWTQAVPVSAQYQKATVNWQAGTSNAPSFLFRCSNTTTGSAYAITFWTASDSVTWDNLPNMTGSSTNIATASLQIFPGDTLGVTVELTGNNTVVRIWKNPTGLPTRANDWNGDTTPDVTFTQNPATPRDAGTFIGLSGAPIDVGANLTWDNWFGGGVIDSAGQLFTVDLFESLSLSENRSGSAGFNRSYADPLVILEALGKITAFQKAVGDALALSENLATAKTIGKSVADLLSLGESLSKGQAKALADSLSLSELVSKTLVLVRSLSDPLTLNENVVRNALFARLQSELLVLNEAIARAWAFVRSLSDPLTLGESLTSSATFRKSVADALALSESLSKLLVLVRNLADPMVLGETVTKQLIQALTKSLSDPMVLGETVTKQLIQALLKSLSDPITLNEAIGKLLLLARSLSDTLVINENVGRVANFKPSVADALVISEALATALSYVRVLGEPLGLGESVLAAKLAFRSLSDSLSLSEAVLKLLIRIKGLSDPLLLGELVTKLKIPNFRPAWATRNFHIGLGI